MAADPMIAETIAAFSPFLDPAVAGFLSRVHGPGLAPYRARLTAHGFQGHRRVLDAGCGFGQWSLAMAALNESVVAVDVAPERLLFLDRLRTRLNIGNLDIRRAEIQSVPEPDQAFDAIFCYGTLFLTPWRDSLVEFARLLRPGGRLYVNANGLGWYLYLWQSAHNASADYDPRRLAGKAMLNTLDGQAGRPTVPGQDVIIEPNELEDALRTTGFTDIRHGPEGTVVDPSFSEPIKPFFAGSYHGMTSVYEAIAHRGI